MSLFIVGVSHIQGVKPGEEAHLTMKKRLLLIILLLASFAYAQDEIGYQSVRIGENIQQYAIIDEIGPSGVPYRRLCASGCSCELSLKDTVSGEYRYVSKSMTQIGPGLFGYRVASQDMISGRNYKAEANCSYLTVWGIAYSDVRLGAYEEPVGAEDGTAGLSAPYSGTCTGAEWDQILPCYLDKIVSAVGDLTAALNPGLWITSALSRLYLKWGESVGTIPIVGTAIMTILKALYGIVATIGMSIVKLVGDPGLWYKEDFIGFWVSLARGILVVLLVPVMLIECAIIGHTVLSISSLAGRQKLFKLIIVYFTDHLIILRGVYLFIVSMFIIVEKTLSIVTQIINVLKTLVLGVISAII